MRRLLGAVVVVGLLTAGCGSQRSEVSTPPAVADASRVDMCAVLTDAELTGLGIKLGTRKRVNELGVVGCQWVGKLITLRLERDKDPLAEYQARRDDPAFTSFSENRVNGRAGIQLSVERGRTDCAQLMDGGSVSLTVAVAPAFSPDRPKIDSCAEALRIAQMIEPRLPKGGI
ncbi:MAG TPA: DUF3558 family protein [Pseudonocardiaceae bacterium]|nr:DUF3558 family protein [Pseudonocardiaceae bacterium]